MNKKEKEISNKCEKCGGSKSNFADDYFIRKCWCYEFDELETSYELQEEYGHE